MEEKNKEICDKTRSTLSDYVDYVHQKINSNMNEALKTGNTDSDMALCECIRTLNHVSVILLKLKEVESGETSQLTVHNNYAIN